MATEIAVFAGAIAILCGAALVLNGIFRSPRADRPPVVRSTSAAKQNSTESDGNPRGARPEPIVFAAGHVVPEPADARVPPLSQPAPMPDPGPDRREAAFEEAASRPPPPDTPPPDRSADGAAGGGAAASDPLPGFVARLGVAGERAATVVAQARIHCRQSAYRALPDERTRLLAAALALAWPDCAAAPPWNQRTTGLPELSKLLRDLGPDGCEPVWPQDGEAFDGDLHRPLDAAAGARRVRTCRPGLRGNGFVVRAAVISVGGG